ncbi:hypothetical protein ACI79J_06380 [Geodermatophilus sp. SYSU D01062]
MAVRARGRTFRLLLAVLFVVTFATTSPAQALQCTETDPIAQHHCELGGAASVVGTPVGAPYDVAGGRAQEFTAGTIYWSPATGAHEVHGWIRDAYWRLGGPVGFLGFPVTDENRAADGVGAFSHFQGGSVFSSPGTGAHEVHGWIRDEWFALGAERGFLGYPVSDENRAADGVGAFSHFQGGSVFSSPATGAHEVHGWIRDKWFALGAERGFLGYPVSDENRAADGVGAFSHFQGGSVFSSPATGAHEVHGWIRDKWFALGAERGFLGYPVSDENRAADGVGAFSHFQGGSVFSSPATGAHEVHGAIRDRWAAQGWERGPLGYPITDEYTVNGGRQSDFQTGFLRWTAATGAVRTALLEPYEHAGTWVTRYRFSREYGGANPVTTPAQVDAMADAGVHTLHLQAAVDDPAYPSLLSPDLLGQFLTRAHARGMQVVAWYLPHFTDVAADLRRFQAMADFRASGQAFDAIGVDIEDRTVTDVATRNARLVDLSARLAAALPGTTLAAIVLPPVVTDVLNTAYWPDFPWRQLSGSYQVWMPMAYWTNRTAESGWRDPYRYTAENVARVRTNLGEPCAAVSVIGGYGTTVTAADYRAMAQAAADQGAVGVSVFDWATTPVGSWPPLRGYDVRGC